MQNSGYVFLRFLQRDLFIYKNRYTKYILNYGILYPILYAFAIGYIMAQAYFGNNPMQASNLFIGHIQIVMLVFANNLNISLLFDLENERFIDYQLMLLSPRLIILERILFASLFTFAISLPFYPIAKLLLGAAFVTTHMSIFHTLLILYASSLCCSAYTQFAACVIPSSRKLRSFWMRVNFGLITLGGLFIPWNIIKKFSTTLGYITLANPLLYITEGLRRAILDGPEFIPVYICAVALLGFSLLFTLLSFYFFKKRVDHI